MTHLRYLCLIALMLLTSMGAVAQYTVTPTQASQTVFQRTTNGYDYVPTIMFDGKYRMWWCGSRPDYPADHIFYAEANSINGPWTKSGSTVANTFDAVLSPSGSASKFDGDHTCDPSIVRAGGVYYMYYGGTASGAPPQATTAIGVAQSSDGIHWARMNNGLPILSSHPSRYPYAGLRTYGTGQPSVVVMRDWFYLIHTDHLGIASNPGNGAGQYALRSRDPLFQRGVQAMTAAGWIAIEDQIPGASESFTRYQNRTSYSMVEAFSVDWTFSDMLDSFVVARDNEAGKTDLSIWNNLDYGHQNLAPRLTIPGGWVDGPAIIRRPDGHAMPSTNCGEVPVDLIRSVGPDVFSSQLSATRAMLYRAGSACTWATWGGVFESWKIATAGLPLMLVVNGMRLQFALQAPADQLSKNTISIPGAIYQQITYGASLYSGNAAWSTPGQPIAFLMDDGRLWPVSCAEILSANNTRVRGVTAAQFAQTPKGPPLFCVR